MEEIDFTCRKCGIECLSAPDSPERAICENCCEDHEYKYDRYERGTFCIHCNKMRDDYYE